MLWTEFAKHLAKFWSLIRRRLYKPNTNFLLTAVLHRQRIFETWLEYLNLSKANYNNNLKVAMKSKHILWALPLLFLSSCTIRFDRYPKNVQEQFPAELCGKYLFTSRQDTDSTYIIITSNTIKFTDNHILRGGTLSDSIKLAKGNKYYFLCQGDTINNKLVWDVYPIDFHHDKLFLYAIDAEFYKKSIPRFFTPIQGIDNYYKMDEMQLDRFCKKKLRHRHAMKLVKVH